MKALNALILTAAALSFSPAHAAEYRTIESFSVVRDGGGHMETKVTRTNADGYTGVVTSCNFHELTQAEQEKTRFTLDGKAARDAAAILGDRAVFAERIELEPGLATGSFPSLEIAYSWNLGDMTGNEVKKIQNPIVIIGGKISDVYELVEQAARESSGSVCN